MAASNFTPLQTKLHEIASHAYNLAMSLQNIAPPSATSGTSVKYLIEISLRLEKITQDIEKVTSDAK